ncbi:hypothetical protein PFISCL1PPCAC_16855, partial [Pristionchus fissidentatus]
KETIQSTHVDQDPHGDSALSAIATDVVLARSEDIPEQSIVGTSEKAIPVEAAIVTPSKDSHEQLIVGTSESAVTIEAEVVPSVDVKELRIEGTSKPELDATVKRSLDNPETEHTAAAVTVQSLAEQEESINDTTESVHRPLLSCGYRSCRAPVCEWPYSAIDPCSLTIGHEKSVLTGRCNSVLLLSCVFTLAHSDHE